MNGLFGGAKQVSTRGAVNDVASEKENHFFFSVKWFGAWRWWWQDAAASAEPKIECWQKNYTENALPIT